MPYTFLLTHCDGPVEYVRLNRPEVRNAFNETVVAELLLTGARFSAARAKEIGLVHAVAEAGSLDATVDAYVQECLTGGPEAMAVCVLTCVRATFLSFLERPTPCGPSYIRF